VTKAEFSQTAVTLSTNAKKYRFAERWIAEPTTNSDARCLRSLVNPCAGVINPFVCRANAFIWHLRSLSIILLTMATVSLCELLGLTVYDASGAVSGRVREVALTPQEDRSRVSLLIVKTPTGNRVLPLAAVSAINGGVRASTPAAEWVAADASEGLLLLSRDLLDQQVIDVHGRKVVRVNDVDFHHDSAQHRSILRVGGVDVGARGAVRRLLKGMVPAAALRALLQRVPPREIPWDFVDLIETDPARRVKLKISHERLARLHPADIADIVESLAPDEREAVFETLDEGVAAGALEELEPKVQKAVLESLDSDRAADIVEEMEPDAAADLLGDLSDERTEEILVQMQPAERQEVTDLLEFKENSAAGRMTTEYIALPVAATANDAIEAMRSFEGRMENMSIVYLTDSHGTLAGAVPLVKIVLAPSSTPLLALAQEPLISCHENTKEKEFAELFDKYNLLTLPVIDEHNRLTGVITPDDVIAMLRAKL
jgi:magnesium transporter